MFKTAKAEVSRDKILHSAVRLFRKRGFAKTSMRDIAKDARMALGATYYYFRTKEDLVAHFYWKTQRESTEAGKKIIEKHRTFESRFRELTLFKLEQLAPYRPFLGVLAKLAMDVDDPLSPFAKQTRAVREEAIALVGLALEKSDIEVDSTLAPLLPRLLWLLQMGILFFWITDKSKGQRRTRELIDKCLPLLVTAIRVSSLPLLAGMNREIVSVLQLFETKQGRA